MSDTAYAEVRCLRPIRVGKETLQKGDIYCAIKFPSKERLDHFQRNLRWSAFKVVEVDGRSVKGPVKDHRALAIKDLMKIDGIGDAIAAHLFDVHGVKNLNDLANAITTSPNKLMAENELGITEKTIEHWQRQL
jgi:hypothetical protein